jgi:hypothetical protein
MVMVAPLLTVAVKSAARPAFWTTDRLAKTLAKFSPQPRDLRNRRTWALEPPVELLAAVRRNSTLACWLAALPELGFLSQRSRET